MTETGAIRALCGAIDDLHSADAATVSGLVSDHIRAALAHLKDAMRLLIDGEDEYE